MACKKYTIANGCGHINVETFKYCNGEHDNTGSFNDLCYRENFGADRDPITVRMGNSFCNRGCEAMTVGWRCCTCGYKQVNGYYHPVAMMLVHDDPFGEHHGFCNRCLTDIEYIAKKADGNAAANVNDTPPPYAVRPEAMPLGLNTIPTPNTTPDADTRSLSSDDGSMNYTMVVNNLIDLMNVTVAAMDTSHDVIPNDPTDPATMITAEQAEMLSAYYSQVTD